MDARKGGRPSVTRIRVVPRQTGVVGPRMSGGSEAGGVERQGVGRATPARRAAPAVPLRVNLPSAGAGPGGGRRPGVASPAPWRSTPPASGPPDVRPRPAPACYRSPVRSAAGQNRRDSPDLDRPDFPDPTRGLQARRSAAPERRSRDRRYGPEKSSTRTRTTLDASDREPGGADPVHQRSTRGAASRGPTSLPPRAMPQSPVGRGNKTGRRGAARHGRGHGPSDTGGAFCTTVADRPG
jgi:hypothetical protein